MATKTASPVRIFQQPRRGREMEDPPTSQDVEVVEELLDPDQDVAPRVGELEQFGRVVKGIHETLVAENRVQLHAEKADKVRDVVEVVNHSWWAASAGRRRARRGGPGRRPQVRSSRRPLVGRGKRLGGRGPSWPRGRRVRSPVGRDPRRLRRRPAVRLRRRRLQGRRPRDV